MKVGDIGWVIDSPLNEDEENTERFPVRPWRVKVTSADPKYRFLTKARGFSESESVCFSDLDECSPELLYATEREAWIAYADVLHARACHDLAEVASVRRRFGLDWGERLTPGRVVRNAYALSLNDIADDNKPWGELPDETRAACEYAAQAVLDYAASLNEEPNRVLLSPDDVATFIALGGLDP